MSIKMTNKKRSEKIIKLFSLTRFLSSQLNKKIIKLQHRANKRQAKLNQAHAEAHHDHTGHDHK